MLNIFYRRSTTIVFRTVLFDTLWRLRQLLFFEENIFKVFLYLCFFCPKTSNFHSPGMIGHRKLCDSSVNIIFDVLSIGLQYTLSFKWTDFGLKCLVTITSKGQSLKFNASVWNIPNSETGQNCNSFFKLDDSNWVVIIEQKRKMEYSWTCTFRASQDFSRFQGFLGWSKM